MTPDLIGEAVVDLMILAGFLVVLGIGALIADYVFPHIPFIQRYLEACLTGELPPPTIVEEISSAPSSETYRLISTPQTSILSMLRSRKSIMEAKESGIESAAKISRIRSALRLPSRAAHRSSGTSSSGADALSSLALHARIREA